VITKPCGMHYSWPSYGTVKAGTIGPCVLDVADHHERHRDEYGNEWLNVQWALRRLDDERREFRLAELVLDPRAVPNEHGWGRIESVTPPPADEPVPVSPPVDPFEPMFGRITQADRDLVARTTGGGIRSVDVQPQYEDEATPVSPPVDALLKLVIKYGFRAREEHVSRAVQPLSDARDAQREALQAVSDAARDLWAAGVEEGRRQRDAEVRATVLASAREAAAAFGPVPESVTVSYERRPTAYEEGIYDAGIKEGRRQAAEAGNEAAAYERGNDCPTCGSNWDDRG